MPTACAPGELTGVPFCLVGKVRPTFLRVRSPGCLPRALPVFRNAPVSVCVSLKEWIASATYAGRQYVIPPPH